MALKPFKYWKRQEVQETFGLQRVFEMSLIIKIKKSNTKRIGLLKNYTQLQKKLSK